MGVTRLGEPAWAISASRSERTVPNSFAPTFIVSPATVGLGRPDDRLDEILDGEELVAVRAVAEHVDPAALVIQSNRISKTPRRSGPMNVFGRTIDVEAAAPNSRQTSSASIFDSP